ncbi:MAG: hypothetical protein AAB897_02555 [Patescibacteria group bacterium]
MKYRLKSVAMTAFLVFSLCIPLALSAQDEESYKRERRILGIFDSVWKSAEEKGVVVAEQRPKLLAISKIESPSEQIYSDCFAVVAFVENDGSIVFCPEFFPAEIGEQKYVMAHEIVHLIKKHHLVYGNASGAMRVVYECEATVGATEIVGNELVNSVLEKLLERKFDQIHELAYRRAKDVLSGKDGSCNAD